MVKMGFVLHLVKKNVSNDAVLKLWPNSTSGFYDTTNSKGYVEKVYCHITELCGSDGPWTDILICPINPSGECPEGFHKYSDR